MLFIQALLMVQVHSSQIGKGLTPMGESGTGWAQKEMFILPDEY